MISRRKLLLFAVSGLLGSSVPVASAQVTVGQQTDQVLASFGEAGALEADPRGQIYVVDAAENVVTVMAPDGIRRAAIGGFGSHAGAFDQPSDVDPTNGQLLLVADTYNGRVQRFSEEGQYLEALPIGSANDATGTSWISDDGRAGRTVQGEGRPIAVAQGGNGTVFVIDQRGGRLWRWSEMGGLQQIAGGPSRPERRLAEPIDVTLGTERRVYVADAAPGEVLMYDQFGSYLRHLSLPPLSNLQALKHERGRLWIVCSDRIFTWNRSRRQVSKRHIDLDDPLVDAVPTASGLYLLTPKHLIRRSR